MSLTGALQQQALDLQANLFCLGNKLQSQVLSISEIGDYVPGSVMVQDLGSMTNLYMNKFGCDYLRCSSEELRAIGPDYFRRFFPAEEMLAIKHGMFGFISLGDYTRLHSFLQRVRPDCNSEYSWYFTTSRLIQQPDDATSMNLVHIAVPINTLNITGYRVSNMIENDDYIRKNFQRFNLLSAREKEVIRMIVEGKSSYEIANALFRSIHTINTHRKNILHKLEVNSLAGLIKFAVAFNIV